MSPNHTDKLTKTTQREVKEDLCNFKRLVSASSAGAGSASLLAPDQDAVELGAVAAAMAGLVSGAVVGGVLAYLTHPTSAPLSWTRPASWVSSSAQRTAQWRTGAYQSLFNVSSILLANSKARHTGRSRRMP